MTTFFTFQIVFLYNYIPIFFSHCIFYLLHSDKWWELTFQKSKIHSVIHNRVFLSRAIAWDFDSPYPRWPAALVDNSVHWKVGRNTKGRFRQDCRLSHLWCYCVTGKRQEDSWEGRGWNISQIICILPDSGGSSDKSFQNDTETVPNRRFIMQTR